eukprot:1224797-Amphidinium_carterae.1
MEINNKGLQGCSRHAMAQQRYSQVLELLADPPADAADEDYGLYTPTPKFQHKVRKEAQLVLD